MTWWGPTALAFGLVFVAELGDKTQLALVALAARGRAWRVWVGAAAALGLLAFVAAWLGDLLGDAIPRRPLGVAAGLLFVAFGIHALWRWHQPEEDEDRPPRRAGMLGAFLLMLVAEAGDKTQLAIAALGARPGSWLAPAVGGTLALWVSAALAVTVGAWLASRVAARHVQLASGVLFVAVGLWIAVAAR